MSAYFVTATGTDVGKTFCTAGLLRVAPGRATAIKPVLSGYDPTQAAASDAGVLLAAMGQAVTAQTVAAIAPWRFAAPLSPDMAAAREGRRIDFSELTAFCAAAIAASPGPLFIEGVGGVMVPLDETHTVRDCIAALRLPALLVAGSYLGTISHTLTSIEALLTRDIPIAAILLNESPNSPAPPAETAAVLRRFCATPIHIIPRHTTSAFAAIATHLQREP